MNGNAVPGVLREHLGPEATGGLLEVFEMARREWRDNVIAVCAERFDRHLVEETSKLQLAMIQGDAALRQEMTAMGGGLRQEMSEGRLELLKWCFLFWVGQVIAVAGVMGLMLRMFRP
jgi:predicted flavoprotein YhiN